MHENEHIVIQLHGTFKHKMTLMHSNATDCVFYPYFQGFMEGRSLLVVYVFTSPDSPRGPQWNEGHWPKVRHETSVLEVPASGTT